MPRGDVFEVFGRLNHRDGRWSLRPDEGGEWRLDLGWKRQRRFVELLGRRTRLTMARRARRSGASVGADRRSPPACSRCCSRLGRRPPRSRPRPLLSNSSR